MIRKLSLVALAAVLVAPTARAQTQVQATGATGAVNDVLFAEVAAIGGLAELTISELGQTKATDPELKKFSSRMIADHTRLNQQLMTLAGQKGIALPKTLDTRSTFCSQSLAGLSGEKFDMCYAKAQVQVHMESVAAFEAEAERGQDPDVKALAAKALPVIKEHLQMIKPIAMRYEKDQNAAGAHGNQDTPRP
ncbi:hypothetical protein OJF2_62880 [Aquisphaera giovannonii]|uniref:DUF4142 domain-containing protein n=1 Tax=Aquisphaera giovannonii TaxID=406548 RepID=A0A5B9WB34_9BACT|nr:DUF4142 domain-containing protein [Aquisphaera giovannonii]QEH37697.1 hypothetical protein OJF2_62880 [Aquisphaera giovannonii]